MPTEPYNPLDKLNLAKSIEIELLSEKVEPLGSSEHVIGSGIYAIYYTGNFKPYVPIAEANANDGFTQPIYVGKAIPKGGRKGGFSKVSWSGKALADRLRQHATSVEEVSNLKVSDFFFRHLVVDDIWIPLGENMLIETFQPIWNRALDGFGNRDPGRRRATQFKSPWDVLHPGRKFAEKLGDGGMTQEFLEQRIRDYLAGRPLAKLPRKIVEQQMVQALEAEEGADEVEL